MDDLIDRGDAPAPGGPGGNVGELSVSELSGRIRRAVEDAFGHVRVRGEIGRVSRPRSGHVYLDLKDANSVIAGVIWRSTAQRLKIAPEEGLEVVAEGRITTFPGQSKYQLVIERLAPAGAGALMAMLEERRKRLEAEGLFAAERKRPPPYLPEVIGVVTSPSGAVIRDILHRLADRFPRRVLLWPVAVQGERSAAEVTAAIEGFNALPAGGLPRPDVLIVARGGGSIEDLWSFNEETVARAAAASAIPVISAVGHETDTTLIDFAADRRAPTPTAAAEMAVPVRAELQAALAALEARRAAALARTLESRGQRLRDVARALPRPEALTGAARQRLDFASERLPRALIGFTRALELRLSRSAARLRPSALRNRLAEAMRRTEAAGARLGPALSRTAAGARERFETARLEARLAQAEARRRQEAAARLDGLSARAAPALLRAAAQARDRFQSGAFQRRLGRAGAARIEAARDKLGGLVRLLDTVSHKATLARGYAAIRGPKGLIARTDQVAEGDALVIELSDGRIQAVAGGADGGPAPGPAQSKRTDQGDLF